jgi:uncharacterized protein involved in exopolysaccharide biosynthesis
MDRRSVEPIPDAGVSGERVICVVARDVLSLERREAHVDGLIATLWKGRWLILACVLGFGLLSTAYALVATKWYVADVVLTPAPATTQRGLAGALGGLGASLGGLGGGLGALAGMAGISLGATNTAEPIGVLKSRDFARQFIEEQGLLHVLLYDKWDARTGRWKETDPTPDVRDAIRYFEKHVLTVQEDKKTSLVTVSVEWKDPVAAAYWANTIVDRLNVQMRSRALEEAQANVDYLQKELVTTTNVVAIQQAISRLLETEMQKLMVARGNKEFAFRVVDPAQVPKWRSWPKRTVIVSLGILAGGLAGLLAVWVRESYKRTSLNKA